MRHPVSALGGFLGAMVCQLEWLPSCGNRRAGHAVPVLGTRLPIAGGLKRALQNVCRTPQLRGLALNPHAVERLVNEEERHEEERCRQSVRQRAALAGGETHG